MSKFQVVYMQDKIYFCKQNCKKPYHIFWGGGHTKEIGISWDSWFSGNGREQLQIRGSFMEIGWEPSKLKDPWEIHEGCSREGKSQCRKGTSGTVSRREAQRL